MLVGNKTDLTEKRQVSLEEGQANSKTLEIMFEEVSAKAGINIKTLFKNIAQRLPGIEGVGGLGGKPGEFKLDQGQTKKSEERKCCK